MTVNTKEIPYVFHPSVVLRTPAFPLSSGVDRETILSFFEKPYAREALYLASPVLSEQYHKWLAGRELSPKETQKLFTSLARYYYRMHTRCTPFGLFAGLSVTQWSSGPTEIVLRDIEMGLRKTRIDMYTVCLIQEYLMRQEFMVNNLYFFPNSTLYQIGDELRYIEYIVNNGKRNHQISAVSGSEFLEMILRFCEKGKKISDVVEMLGEHEVDPEEAREFLLQLIDAQLLVSELEPNLTGTLYFDRLLGVIDRIKSENGAPEVASICEILREIADKTNAIDRQMSGNVAVYGEVLRLLKQLGLPLEENKVFQVDMARSLEKGGLNDALCERFRRMLFFLNKLTPFSPPETWQDFAKKINERYEGREVPLLQVLDDDVGPGFGDNIHQDDNFITKNVQLPAAERFGATTWTREQNWLFTKILEAAAQNAYTVTLNLADLQYDDISWEHLPPSFSIIFRLAGEGKVWVETVGNTSAANLLGRFADLHPGVHDLVRDICETEQAMNDAVIFAEIIHLPESRVGNILLRPAFRKYEIPFLGKSEQAEAFQIQLQDLYVSVNGSRVILRSRRLNKEIIPKLGTAHNYNFLTQPLYQFLCDLQNQDYRFWLTFTLGDLGSQLSFVPRIEFEGIILNPATWILSPAVFEAAIQAPSGKQRLQEIGLIREKYRMPRQLLLVEADIEMPVDLEDTVSCDLLVDDIKNRGQVLLKEFLADKSGLVCDTENQLYANQFICSLIRQKPVYYEPTPRTFCADSATMQREFIPGDAWMYLKLYTGVKSTDNLLGSVLLPLVEQLKNEQRVRKWFYVRYADPDHHLRFRLLLSDPSEYGRVTAMINEALSPLLVSGALWKVQHDTYKREVERYGAPTMEIAESWFDADSTATAFFIASQSMSDDLRWLWAICSADALLESMRFSIDDKIRLFKGLKEGFAREFRMDKLLLKQLATKYREQRDLIRQALDQDIMTGSSPLPPYFRKALELRDQLTAPCCQALLNQAGDGRMAPAVDELMASCIHMMFNRIFPSYQRKNEMVIYDFIYQHYKSAAILSTV